MSLTAQKIQKYGEHIPNSVFTNKKKTYELRGCSVFKSASEVSCSYSCPRNFLLRCAEVGFFCSSDLTSPKVLISSFLLVAEEHKGVCKNYYFVNKKPIASNTTKRTNLAAGEVGTLRGNSKFLRTAAMQTEQDVLSPFSPRQEE